MSDGEEMDQGKKCKQAQKQNPKVDSFGDKTILHHARVKMKTSPFLSVCVCLSLCVYDVAHEVCVADVLGWENREKNDGKGEGGIGCLAWSTCLLPCPLPHAVYPVTDVV